jgi:hypothetical protein
MSLGSASRHAVLVVGSHQRVHESRRKLRTIGGVAAV